MKVYEVDPDGNCFFTSIAFGILYRDNNNTPPNKTKLKQLSQQLRRIATDYLNEKINKNNADFISYLSGYIQNNIRGNMSFNVQKQRAKNYVKQMKQNCQWGGNIELIALTSYIHSQGFKGVQVVNDGFKNIRSMRTNINNSKPKRVLKIRLLGIERGGTHFDFVDNKISINKKSKSANNQKPIAISNLNWNKVEIPNHPGNNWVVVS